MSGGPVCKCEEKEKPISERDWVVWQCKCNYSAFSGYRKTDSDYSLIRCNKCLAGWRTKASYVDDLKLAD